MGEGGVTKPMARFILLRLIRTFVTVWGVITAVFFILRLSGDPVSLLLPPFATRAEQEALRVQLGLDQSIFVQYLFFIVNALRGDLGDSLYRREPALGLVLERLPATLELALISFALAVVVAIPLGIVASLRPRSLQDHVASIITLIGQAAPTFWIGIMLILVFSVTLNWLPTSGRGDIRQLIMPSVTLGAYAMASIARLTRMSMLEVLRNDYIRVARAKGLKEQAVILQHAVKNAAIPVITVMGLQFGILLSGAVVTETIFAWPGIGRLAIQSIYNRDYPVVQATVVVTALIFVLINLVVDLLYTVLDPRIRLSK